MSKTGRFLLVVSCVVALLAGFYLSGPHRGSPPDMAGLLWPDTRPVPEFRLIDQSGAAFTREQLGGRWNFVFFGFTHCPDICPLTLQLMDTASKLIAGQSDFGPSTGFVFVSVDPERDTPAVLDKYVGYFNPDFIGLTGEPGEIDGLASGLGIVYARMPPDDAGNYSVDHSAVIVLVNPEGELAAIFSAPHGAAEIADQYVALRRYISG